jgi:hypothetical protein
MTEAETILVTIGNQCPDCQITWPLAYNFCGQCGLPLPALCCEGITPAESLVAAIEQSYEENQDYEDIVSREVAVDLLKESPLYNKMITIPCKNGKGKRHTIRKRLIDLLLSRDGDLLEAVSPKVFEHLNGYYPKQSSIIQHHVLGNNGNASKVDIYEACDGLYSELGYNSCQDMLNEVESLKELARGTR